MRRRWAGSLGLVLGCWTAVASAEDVRWRPATPIATSHPDQQAPAATLLPPVASLGQPVPLATAKTTSPDKASRPDPQVTPVGYTPGLLGPTRPVVRAQGGDPPPPTPPPSSAIPPANVPYQGDPLIGVGPATPPPYHPVDQLPPPAAPGFWAKTKEFFQPGTWTCPGRNLFQSDHAFDGFSSPVSNPFLFEDPRALTEVRPIFIFQNSSNSNPGFQGGNIAFYGTQARVAVTERVSFVLNKLGGVWMDGQNPALGFTDTSGFAEVWLGPKFTLIRSEQTGTLAAAGLTFQIPAGSGRTFQDTGNFSLSPYLSLGQNFLRTSWGSFNALGTAGYSFSLDTKRSEYVYGSLHLDYDLAGTHKFYPLVELNYVHYTRSGEARNLGFEGRDLFNFGSLGVAGDGNLSIATGARYKFSELAQIGAAAEFPLAGKRDLFDFRLTLDLIIRY